MPVTISEDKAKTIDFIQQHPVGVIATADNKGVPHTAAVYFVADTDMNFYFVTKEKTTKHKNLQQNKHASFSVYDAKDQKTLQVEGTAKVVEDVGKFMDLFAKILHISVDTSESSRTPLSKLHAGDYFMYCIKPSKIRIAEYMKPDRGDFGDLFEVVKP